MTDTRLAVGHAISTRMRRRQPLHEVTHGAIGFSTQNQMPMVTHDAVSQQFHLTAGTDNRLFKHTLKSRKIAFFAEHAKTGVRTIQDVVAVTGNVDARRSRHTDILIA